MLEISPRAARYLGAARDRIGTAGSCLRIDVAPADATNDLRVYFAPAPRPRDAPSRSEGVEISVAEDLVDVLDGRVLELHERGGAIRLVALARD
jgi:hypothetical protein